MSLTGLIAGRFCLIQSGEMVGMTEERYYEIYDADTDETLSRYRSSFGVQPDDVAYWSPRKLASRPMRYQRWQDMARENFTYDRWMVPTWSLDPIADHFAHIVSHKETGEPMVSFFASADHGLIWKRTLMKPGRYAARFYPDLTSDEVRDLATEIDKAGEVKFATTPDEIEAVYTNGPRSCMSHSEDEYESPCHPVRVYGAGDLAIAYLGDPDEKVTARVVCWPEKKLYCRTYGDEQRLIPALEKLGYKAGRFEGAKLLKIDADEGFVAPYLDGIEYVRETSKYLVICADGGIACRETNGCTEEQSRYECERCETRYRSDDEFSRVRTGRGSYSFESWCECCTSDNAFYCDGENVHVSDRFESHYIEDRHETWSEVYFADHGWTCDDSGENFSNDAPSFYIEDLDETVCEAVFDRRGYWTHPTTGEHFSEPQELDDDLAEVAVIKPLPRDEHPDQLTFDDALVPDLTQSLAIVADALENA